jgi:hypothetical protein
MNTKQIDSRVVQRMDHVEGCLVCSSMFLENFP